MSFVFRQRLVLLGFVGTGMLGVSSLVVWPKAEGSIQPAFIDWMPPRSVNATPPVESALPKVEQQQIPLNALKMNPFARQTANARSADADRLQLLTALRTLRLESALCTESRHGCSINGSQYAEGDSLSPFVVEKVAQSAVTLRSGVYRFELRLQP